MRDRVLRGQRARAAGLACLLAVVLASSLGSGGAFADDPDDDAGWDVKAMRQFLKDLGLQRDGPQIEYRERAPLVVPPSRNLPPPRDPDSVATNPAWPNDPDVRERKLQSANKKQRRIASEVMEEESRPLPRSELDKGRIPPGTGQTKSAPSPEESGRPMHPTELGTKSIFSGMFSSRKPETVPFEGEPPRGSLTAPPTGYQTPSPNHPYGPGAGPSVEHAPTRPEDRLTGPGR
jgi:hypothetical protein